MRKLMTVTDQDLELCESVRLAIRTASPPIKVRDLAKKVGVSEDVLFNVQNGRSRPTVELLSALRVALNLENSWPYHAGGFQFVNERRTAYVPLSMKRIPVIGSVEAGGGVANVDVEIQTVFVPEKIAVLGSVGYIVEGDSMMPALEPGDIAVFRYEKTPRRGYTALLKTPEGEYKVKLVRWSSNGRWQLYSLNEAYGSEEMDGLEMIGFLVGVYKTSGSREMLDCDPNGLLLDP